MNSAAESRAQASKPTFLLVVKLRGLGTSTDVKRTRDGRQVDSSGRIVSVYQVQILGHLLQDEQMSNEEQLPIKCLAGGKRRPLSFRGCVRLDSFDGIRC